MSHVAEITTPFPTLEEIGASLGISRKRQREILEIVDLHIPKGKRIRSALKNGRAAYKTHAPGAATERSAPVKNQKGQGAKAKGRA